MLEIIEDNDEGRGAKGQSGRDLRISSDFMGLEMQFDIRHQRELKDSSDGLKALSKNSAEDLHSPKSLRRTCRNLVLDVPQGVGPEEAALMETVDNVGDFLRFVETSA